MYFVLQVKVLLITKKRLCSLSFLKSMACEPKNALNKVGVEQTLSVHHSLITDLSLTHMQLLNTYLISKLTSFVNFI